MGDVVEKLHPISPEEYLIREDKAQEKSEFIDGYVVSMAGTSVPLERISRNLVSELHFSLKNKSSEVFSSEVKVAIGHKKAFYYPDAMVVCGDLSYARGRNDMIDNPILIIEIISPESEIRDRGEKFLSYQTLPSLQEYVLISQNQVNVEIFSKDEKGWRYNRYSDLDGKIAFQSVGVEVALRDLYDRVEMEMGAQ